MLSGLDAHVAAGDVGLYGLYRIYEIEAKLYFFHCTTYKMYYFYFYDIKNLII